MQVVADTEKESDCQEIQKELKSYCPNLSFSPVREQPSLRGCLEFFATAKIDDECKEALIKNLNNDWDEEDDVYTAYGFNTKMFNPKVYWMLMEFSD